MERDIMGRNAEEIKLEQEWIEEKIKDILSKPYFFKNDILVIAREDLENVYKRLKDRIWTDRHGQTRLWYVRIITYDNEEEYAWLRIL